MCTKSLKRPRHSSSLLTHLWNRWDRSYVSWWLFVCEVFELHGRLDYSVNIQSRPLFLTARWGHVLSCGGCSIRPTLCGVDLATVFGQWDVRRPDSSRCLKSVSMCDKGNTDLAVKLYGQQGTFILGQIESEVPNRRQTDGVLWGHRPWKQILIPV